VARLGWALACVLVALASSPSHAVYPVVTQAELSAVVDGSPDEFKVQSNRSQVMVTDELLLQSGWNLISIPYQPADPTPEAVFAGISIADNLCRWDWRGLTYIPYDGFDFGPSGFGVCQPGEAYWLNALGGERLAVPHDAALTHATILLPVLRPLLVGTTELRPVSLPDCGTWVDEGNGWQQRTFPELLAMGYFADPLRWYDPINRSEVESDVATERLYPWRGYWLRDTPPMLCLLNLY